RRKARGGSLCFAFKKLGLPLPGLRYFNVTGPRLDAIDVGRVITIFLGQALRNEPVTVVGNGTQTRCFTYVSDAVAATVEAGLREAAIGGIFNVGNDKEISIRSLAERIIAISGSRSGIRYVDQEAVYGSSYEDIPRRVPDIRRMAEVLGVTPTVSLDDGLRRTIESFRGEARAR